MESLVMIIGTYSSVLTVLLCGVFVAAIILRDNSIMDIVYGPLFAVTLWATIFITELWTPLSLTLAILVSLWATRLSLRIARKNWGQPEDARYAAWRRTWMESGYWYFLLRSLVQIYLLQGLIILVVAAPFYFILASGARDFTVIAVVGIGVAIIGLTIETIADWQLDTFLKQKRAGLSEKKIIDTGLFAYARRPNYFGESLVWWGLALMAATYLLPLSILALLSPLTITYIMTAITGPMLEKIFIEKYGTVYREYMNRTNYFIPWPKKG